MKHPVESYSTSDRHTVEGDGWETERERPGQNSQGRKWVSSDRKLWGVDGEEGDWEDVYSFIKADLPDNHCDMTGITLGRRPRRPPPPP